MRENHKPPKANQPFKIVTLFLTENNKGNHTHLLDMSRFSLSQKNST